MYHRGVALRKESVDRNVGDSYSMGEGAGSLSARRAWIEIAAGQATSLLCWSLSARRAWIEILPGVGGSGPGPSLSARRAWIEMPNLKKLSIMASVALRKESVDRNCSIPAIRQRLAASLSARRAWIEMLRPPACSLPAECRSPQGEHRIFLFLTVQGGCSCGYPL